MILDVPYKSQEDIENGSRKDWCALACLSMVLAYYLKDAAPSLEDLQKKYGPTLSAKEYFNTIGIEHKDLLRIAREYNLRGFRKSWWVLPGSQVVIDKFKEEGESEVDVADWNLSNLEEGSFTLEQAINHSIPVIVSVSPEFSPSHSTHLVVLVGIEDNNFIIHDPYKKGANFKISKEEFKKYFLKQAIFILQD